MTQHDDKRAKHSDVQWLSPSFATLDSLDAETLVLLIESDVRPLRGVAGLCDWRLCGRISEALQRAPSSKDATQVLFAGALGEQLLMPTWGRIPATRLLLVGVGAKSSFEQNADAVLQQLSTVLSKLVGKKAAHRIAVAQAVSSEKNAPGFDNKIEQWAKQQTNVDVLFTAT